ncbi:P63C domain-containing protein [Hydromonas duriensis]|uniref:P63C domain-containing protein n=1 Tax=Hydromonas duriensis TaxID=1527608 RepID=A0A4V3DJV5_9BURK|nr:P63C domain-containing protein [Hydromonas duriensis]TDR31620.1 P63C domain-containing protein [Hydromonas duriensis]
MNHEITGKAKGGKALAEKMTDEQKHEKAMKMVEAKRTKREMPRATHKGELKIGDTSISCAVLSNGDRVLVERSVALVLGRKGGGAYWKKKKEELAPILPEFVSANYLKPYISRELEEKLLAPISYIGLDGEVYKGINANVLPEVCDVWITALKDGALKDTQKETAEKAYILFKGFAIIGITALVDEATGYQDEREKDALAKILEMFVASELQPYLKTFPPEYYKGLFRLYGYEYPPKDKRPQWRPAYFGRITNNVIYSRLAPEILPELKKAASKAEKKGKLHQWLSSDIGHPKLREHLASIVSLLKISKTKEEFYNHVDVAHPKFNENYTLDLEED